MWWENEGKARSLAMQKSRQGTGVGLGITRTRTLRIGRCAFSPLFVMIVTWGLVWLVGILWYLFNVVGVGRRWGSITIPGEVHTKQCPFSDAIAGSLGKCVGSCVPFNLLLNAQVACANIPECTGVTRYDGSDGEHVFELRSGLRVDSVLTKSTVSYVRQCVDDVTIKGTKIEHSKEDGSEQVVPDLRQVSTDTIPPSLEVEQDPHTNISSESSKYMKEVDETNSNRHVEHQGSAPSQEQYNDLTPDRNLKFANKEGAQQEVLQDMPSELSNENVDNDSDVSALVSDVNEKYFNKEDTKRELPNERSETSSGLSNQNVERDGDQLQPRSSSNTNDRDDANQSIDMYDDGDIVPKMEHIENVEKQVLESISVHSTKNISNLISITEEIEPEFAADRIVPGEILDAEIAPPPSEFWKPAEDIDWMDVGSKVDGEPTIFIGIASYRDSMCHETIERALSMATRPQNLFFGVVDQTAPGDTPCFYTATACTPESELLLCKHKNQIRIQRVPAKAALGPTWGRHRADALYRGEYFALQIDAHMFFTKDWDSDMIDQFEKTGNENAILSNYPTDSKGALDSNGRSNFRSTPTICDSKFVGDMVKHQSAHEFYPPSWLRGSPILEVWWAAGVSFSRGHRILRVPYDCCLPMMFDGEETSMALRLWTHGYDFYSFHHSAVFHPYNRKVRPPLFWENQSRHAGLVQQAERRVMHILGMKESKRSKFRLRGSAQDSSILKDIEKYSLGSVRPVSTFYKVFGVDLTKHIIRNNCAAATSGDMHAALVPFLRQDKLGIDYSSVPADEIWLNSFKDYALQSKAKTGIYAQLLARRANVLAELDEELNETTTGSKVAKSHKKSKTGKGKLRKRHSLYGR